MRCCRSHLSCALLTFRASVRFRLSDEQVQARFAFPTRDGEFGSRGVEFLNVFVAEQTNERALGANFDLFSSFRVGETWSRSEFGTVRYRFVFNQRQTSQFEDLEEFGDGDRDGLFRHERQSQE